MSASSAASSSLTRARTPIILLSALAAASGIYYLYTVHSDEAETIVPPTGPTAPLRRSNAVHRRRRAHTNDEPGQLFVDPSTDDDGVPIVSQMFTDEDTVAEEPPFQDDYTWNEQPTTYQRSGQNIVQLLFRVSEDATRRNAYVHKGCACNSCNMVPIRGIRYRCANCADFDLCEGCEAQGFHTKTHIFYKIKVPAPSFGPRTIQPVWYTGDPDTSRGLSKNVINKLSRETGFERPELDAYWEQWTFMANYEWREDPDEIYLAMDRKTFERCLVPSGGYKHSAPSLIFDRMFAFYDTNKDDLISFPEFLHGQAFRKKRDKWRKIFEGYDVDENGYVDRKDFLRIFRSYYVLYREMHRDMLESMDEQQMSSADTHRLVSGRQPLSSAFGHDGRFPGAPEIRAGEGKTTGISGDAEVNDGKGVVLESGDDTGNREDLFRGREEVFRRRASANPDSANRRPSGGYWQGILDPPTTVEQMPDVINNIRRFRPRSTNAHPILQIAELDAQSGDIEMSSDDESNHEPTDKEPSPPTFPSVTDEDAVAAAGPGSRFADLVGKDRALAISFAHERERLQGIMNERWKRRQFYTDEEEGATAPAGWNEDNDILAQDGANGESSKAPARPSVHSRSSSKVRFAEELDDFDTRSNPSTSSRSVPERWGGMDIPDAEKDAGKEILFQVTQQAFNELLDSFFEAKEDLAFLEAQTRSDRQQYRHIWDNDWFGEWAKDQEREEEEENKKTSPKSPDINGSPLLHDFQEMEIAMEQANEGAAAQNLDDLRDQASRMTIPELLDATGYSLANDAMDLLPGPPTGSEAQDTWSGDIEHQRTPEGILSRARGMTVTSTGETAPNTIERSSTPTELLSAVDQPNGIFRSPPSELDTPSPPNPSSPSNTSSYDPTMPQNRPNSTTDTKENTPEPGNPDTEKIPTTGLYSPRSRSLWELKAAQQRPADLNHARSIKDVASGEMIPIEYLLKLWTADKAEKEKDERGGWGRLNFKEWEKMVKTFAKDGRSNRMDYLGSWIECCIP